MRSNCAYVAKDKGFVKRSHLDESTHVNAVLDGPDPERDSPERKGPHGFRTSWNMNIILYRLQEASSKTTTGIKFSSETYIKTSSQGRDLKTRVGKLSTRASAKAFLLRVFYFLRSQEASA